jgi:hypothetical protein
LALVGRVLALGLPPFEGIVLEAEMYDHLGEETIHPLGDDRRTRRLRSHGRVEEPLLYVRVNTGLLDLAIQDTIPGTIHGLAPEGGRIRLRIGDLTAECSPAEAARLALADGQHVYATFTPADTRLVR